VAGVAGEGRPEESDSDDMRHPLLYATADLLLFCFASNWSPFCYYVIPRFLVGWLREIVDLIIENVSNKYRLGLAVLHARETGTQRTFGDIAAHIQSYPHKLDGWRTGYPSLSLLGGLEVNVLPALGDIKGSRTWVQLSAHSREPGRGWGITTRPDRLLKDPLGTRQVFFKAFLLSG
jgi:hypothetical protein